jgi:hypothetical protein
MGGTVCLSCRARARGVLHPAHQDGPVPGSAAPSGLSWRRERERERETEKERASEREGERETETERERKRDRQTQTLLGSKELNEFLSSFQGKKRPEQNRGIEKEGRKSV